MYYFNQGLLFNPLSITIKHKKVANSTALDRQQFLENLKFCIHQRAMNIIYCLRAGQAVRAVLKISAILLKYPNLKVFCIFMSKQNTKLEFLFIKMSARKSCLT